MTDMLAIVGTADRDAELIEELARRRADRVTVLVDEADTEESRDRLVRLLEAIEVRTGAIVVGMAGGRDELEGWRFDRVVGGVLT
jgi:hypothetical protein